MPPVRIDEIETQVRETPGETNAVLTPEVIQAIVKRVLALLQEEIIIENERRGGLARRRMQ